MQTKPKYLIVADILRREIAEGVFQDGQVLMTEEDLRDRFGVSRQTVRQAISQLENDGLVDRRRGSGTYVRHGPRKRQGQLHVGVLTSYITDYISPNILSGIEAVMNQHGVVMNLSATLNDPAMERNILERMTDGQMDGLIIEPCRSAAQVVNLESYRRLMERNVPVIFMNAYYPELRGMPYVVMDDLGGGREAAEEILKKGYKKPGGVFKTDDMQGEERSRGFLEEMQQRGIAIPKENLLFFGTAERMDLFDTPEGHRFLERAENPEAMDSVACYNDIFAVNLMEAMMRRGRRDPRELGIIGFDNAMVSEMTRLTTLGHPKEAFGSLVAEKLLRMMDGVRQESVSMPWKLVERDSLPGPGAFARGKDKL